MSFRFAVSDEFGIVLNLSVAISFVVVNPINVFLHVI